MKWQNGKIVWSSLNLFKLRVTNTKISWKNITRIKYPWITQFRTQDWQYQKLPNKKKLTKKIVVGNKLNSLAHNNCLTYVILVKHTSTVTTTITVVLIRQTFIVLNTLCVNQSFRLIKAVQTTPTKWLIQKCTIQVVDTEIQCLSAITSTEKTNTVTKGTIRNIGNNKIPKRRNLDNSNISKSQSMPWRREQETKTIYIPNGPN